MLEGILLCWALEQRPVTCNCFILGLMLVYIQPYNLVLQLTGEKVEVGGKIGTPITNHCSIQTGVVLKYHNCTHILIPEVVYHVVSAIT